MAKTARKPIVELIRDRIQNKEVRFLFTKFHGPEVAFDRRITAVSVRNRMIVIRVEPSILTSKIPNEVLEGFEFGPMITEMVIPADDIQLEIDAITILGDEEDFEIWISVKSSYIDFRTPGANSLVD